MSYSPKGSPVESLRRALETSSDGIFVKLQHCGQFCEVGKLTEIGRSEDGTYGVVGEYRYYLADGYSFTILR